MRTSPGPASSTTFLKRSKSSMPALRVFVMPVSGAQHASAHEMLHAAVHSIYRRFGSRPTSSDRTTGSCPFNGSFSGQSPQKDEPPAFSSARRVLRRVSFQISEILAVLASPRTRFPYGSEQPQTIRPSQSIIRVLHGHEH